MLYLGQYSVVSSAFQPPSDISLHDSDHSNCFFGDYRSGPFPEYLENFYVWPNSFNFAVKFTGFTLTRRYPKNKIQNVLLKFIKKTLLKNLKFISPMSILK